MSTATTTFPKELAHVEKNWEDILLNFQGRYIAIKGTEILGSYDSEVEAIVETQKAHKLGTFLVKYIDPSGEEPVVRFNSRVHF